MVTVTFSQVGKSFCIESCKCSISANKEVYALVVSGYSGGDIVAEQILDAMNCNKNFILPPYFALIETANDPKSILQNAGIEDRAARLAKYICM